MRVLISTYGSYGDLHPYLAIGAELHTRGHETVLATSASYRSKVEAAGLKFYPVRPDISLDDRAMLEYVMDAKHGSERAVRKMAATARDSYSDVMAAAEGADVMVTHPMVFASMLVVQKRRMSWISTALAPISLFSEYDPPILPHMAWAHRFNFLGRRYVRAWAKRAERQAVDWVQPLLEFQAEMGIPAAGFEGYQPPRMTLALFSPLLSRLQPDWPPHTVLTGFPFFDQGELGPELLAFLDKGAPPIVFTLGTSAVGTAGDFYRQSLRTVERLRARAVILTGSHTQDLPERLSEDVMIVRYAPHRKLFERASVVVHHGGVGTTAQAMRAGRPMLIVPFGHDQFDNAQRLKRLGAAEVLPQSRYTCTRAGRLLRTLLNLPAYRAAAESVSAKVRAESGAAESALAIERCMENCQVPAGAREDIEL